MGGLVAMETRSSRHSRTDTHVNSEAVAAQGLHHSGSDGVPVLRGEVGKAPIPNPEIIPRVSPVDKHSQWEN